ncbi:unnamed protein product [Mesocestoides corti]|nr:unnamed protein product [Mesocestoides corti]
MAQLFNIWIPLDTRRLFQLNTINNESPLRDNIAKVYHTLSRAIQLICAVCGRTSVTPDQSTALQTLPSTKFLDQSKPLVGLYCLSDAIQHGLLKSRSFDEPYCLPQSNIFAALVLDAVPHTQPLSKQPNHPRVPVHRKRSGSQKIEAQKYFVVGDGDQDGNRSRQEKSAMLDWDIVSIDSCDE